MIIAATSDLHGNKPVNTRHSKAPDIDVLVFAGDICSHDLRNFKFMQKGNYDNMGEDREVKPNAYWNFRKIDHRAEAKYQQAWAEREVAPWVKALKPKHVLWVNGNHDFLDPAELSFVTHGIKTGSTNVTIEGIKFGLLAGSMTFTGEWSDEVAEEEMKSRIMALEGDIDILVSHVPPYNILDRAYSGDMIGCQELTKAIFGYSGQELRFPKLKHHFFGHVHEMSGDLERMDIKFHNMSNRMAEVSV